MKTKNEELVQDVQKEEVLKLSELFLSKIREAQEKENDVNKLAVDVCSKEFKLHRLEELLASEKEEWEKSKKILTEGYLEIVSMNEKINKDIHDKYGEIVITNIETGEYTLKN